MNICIIRGSLNLMAGTPETEKFFAALELGKRVWLRVLDDKSIRSLNQNRTLFMWLADVSNHTGILKEDLHLETKLRRVVPILQEKDDVWNDLIMRAQQWGPGPYERWVDRCVHTSDLSTKEFSQMLTDMERSITSKGIALRHPEDLKWA